MNNQQCPECGIRTPFSKPQCISCNSWMPWGDRAVAAGRRSRVQEFRRTEMEELQILRHERPGSASGAVNWKWRALAFLHELRLRPALGVPVALVVLLAAGSGVYTLWAALPHKTPHPRTVATGRCVDGTWTYARNRQGACAGHGGVKTFYKN